MGDFTRPLNEILAVVAMIDPGTIGTGTSGTDYVDMSNFRRVMFVVQLGDMETGATLDFKLQESVDGSDPWTDITGKAITQLSDAHSDLQEIVELAAEECSKRYVRGVLTIGVDAVDCAVIALGGVARYDPASAFDLASVDQIVV